ncbi:D-aminoacyl-tRNA deacylase [Kangiella sp. HZ709]|uniref:D-aminoacyl-tRNA deacylase n=1 Tax=Kangiella sp. HZ709 TaxID=2666328 RepID=UPI0012B15EED|nr:D-aminoacyl-tRNA deacylase [Kangiella sp. HZ709]MRX28250.1 D-tyrosyl-tRNA(Tyr) deacylase [Kangiella sp. HZ709]
MIGLLQRVTQSKVSVNGAAIGEIEKGIMVLVGVEKDDTETSADKLLKKLLSYRVFSDAAGKMNLSLKDIEGGLLLVPQFTLAADTDSGLRPSFSSAAPPTYARRLFEYMVTKAQAEYHKTAAGQFGAEMKVELINDGPVTFNLKV